MANAAVVFVFVGEREAGAERHLGADDAVAAEEVFLAAKHVHGAALAFRITAPPTGQFRHHSLGVHVAGQHVAVVAVRRDDRVLGPGRRHHADDNGLLANIEVAETADQAHSVQLPRLFLEAADQQHLSIEVEHFVGRGGGVFFREVFFGCARAFPGGFGGGFGRSFLFSLGRARCCRFRCLGHNYSRFPL